MTGASRRSGALAVAAATLALGGCSNPDAPAVSRGSVQEPGISSPGEPKSAPPPPALSYTAASVKRTPAEALASFAAMYVNWSYRNLASEQRALAAISVGAARMAELQAAATSSSDTTISRARVANRGTVVSVARDRTQASAWVLVTREQTSGSGDYEGLPGSYHVTVARLASVPGGYAVSEWLPQS
jgi:hypothetical protein